MSCFIKTLCAKKCPSGVNTIRILKRLLHCKQTLPARQLSRQIKACVLGGHIIFYNVIGQMADSVQFLTCGSHGWKTFRCLGSAKRACSLQNITHSDIFGSPPVEEDQSVLTVIVG